MAECPVSYPKAVRNVTNDGDLIDRICAEYAGRHVKSFMARYEAVKALTESPIEAALCCALAAEFHDRAWALWQTTGLCSYSDIQWHRHCDILVVPQYPVGRYRADMMVLVRDVKPARRFAIECDGRDFHDANAGQADRDRYRDRCFLSDGIQTIRFSGAEIVANPIRCAVSALNIILSDAYKLRSDGGV